MHISCTQRQSGKLTDWLSSAQVLHHFYHQFTGLPMDRVEEETDRDNFVGAKQAVELGLIDSIL